MNRTDKEKVSLTSFNIFENEKQIYQINFSKNEKKDILFKISVAVNSSFYEKAKQFPITRFFLTFSSNNCEPGEPVYNKQYYINLYNSNLKSTNEFLLSYKVTLEPFVLLKLQTPSGETEYQHYPYGSELNLNLSFAFLTEDNVEDEKNGKPIVDYLLDGISIFETNLNVKRQ